MTTDSDSNGRENQLRRAGRPSKLTPELKEEILTAIGKGGCTYADACFKAGINESTFHRWKQKGQEQDRGRFREFCNELKGAEAGFRAVRLQRIVDAAEQSKVRIKKTVRSMGDGGDAKIFQEVVEDTVLPDPKWDAWLLEHGFAKPSSWCVVCNSFSAPVVCRWAAIALNTAPNRGMTAAAAYWPKSRTRARVEPCPPVSPYTTAPFS